MRTISTIVFVLGLNSLASASGYLPDQPMGTLFEWKVGTLNGEETEVYGARVTPRNLSMAKYLLTGKPVRLRLTTNCYLINFGNSEKPRFSAVPQGAFVAKIR